MILNRAGFEAGSGARSGSGSGACGAGFRAGISADVFRFDETVPSFHIDLRPRSVVCENRQRRADRIFLQIGTLLIGSQRVSNPHGFSTGRLSLDADVSGFIGPPLVGIEGEGRNLTR